MIEICTACEQPAIDGLYQHNPEVPMHASTSLWVIDAALWQ